MDSDALRNPYDSQEGEVMSSWERRGAKVNRRWRSPNLEIMIRVLFEDGEELFIPKVELDEETHVYSFNDIVVTKTHVHWIRYNPDIVSISSLKDYTEGKKKNWGTGACSKEQLEVYSKIFKHCILRHLQTVEKERYTYRERYERFAQYQRDDLGIPEPKKILHYLTPMLFEDLEFRAFHDGEKREDTFPLTDSLRNSRYLFEEVLRRFIPDLSEDKEGYNTKWSRMSDGELLGYLMYRKPAEDGTKIHLYLEYRMRGRDVSEIFLETQEEKEAADELVDVIQPHMKENGVEFGSHESVQGSYIHQIAGKSDSTIKFLDEEGEECLGITDYKRAHQVYQEIFYQDRKGNQRHPLGGEFKGPLSCLNELPPERRCVIDSALSSSDIWRYAYQLGAYKELFRLNGYKVSPFIYIFLIDPLLEGILFIEIDLRIFHKRRLGEMDGPQPPQPPKKKRKAEEPIEYLWDEVLGAYRGREKKLLKSLEKSNQ